MPRIHHAVQHAEPGAASGQLQVALAEHGRCIEAVLESQPLCSVAAVGRHETRVHRQRRQRGHAGVAEPQRFNILRQANEVRRKACIGQTPR